MNAEKPSQSFGKKAAKIFLPVLIGFNVPFLGIQIDALLNPIDLDKAGKGAMLGSQVFDYVLVPAMLVILLIIQWVMILPMWNRIFVHSRRVLLSSLIIGIFISVLTGMLFGYLVCTEQSDMYNLINAVLLMCGLIVAYCILNTVTLYLLDRSYIKYLKARKQLSN